MARLARKIPLGFARRDFKDGACLWFCAPHPLVSAAASGAGRQWRPFSADGRGNVDRFAAERHWRSLTPSRAHTWEIFLTSQARKGEIVI